MDLIKQPPHRSTNLSIAGWIGVLGQQIKLELLMIYLLTNGANWIIRNDEH